MFVAEIQVLEPRALLSASLPQFVDPHPSLNDGFGTNIVTLKNGNEVISAPNDDAGGTGAGAVYLFNGSTGEVISTLVGSRAGDFQYCDIKQVGDSNFVVINTYWDNGAAIDAGAVTWGSGTTGVSGVIGAANSLVGSSAGDEIGFAPTTVLSNGNYVVVSPLWTNGAATEAGAVTFGSGATGVHGVVSAANSLVGSHVNDKVGALGSWIAPQYPNRYGVGVTALPDGNFVVESLVWNNDSATQAGAVTWSNGTTGIHGVVSASNSLVGSSSNDRVGSGGVTVLKDGNYLISSPNWSNGTATSAGAVTWGRETTGIHGVVSSSNSLVGTHLNDAVGSSRIVQLTNGNYVVDSSNWNQGAGAVTFGKEATGVHGNVSSSNSLVGGTPGDRVGGTSDSLIYPPGWLGTVYFGPPQPDIQTLNNGDYVVTSRNWHNGSIVDAGAVTTGDGTKGVHGIVSRANSFVGNMPGEKVGSGGVVGLNGGAYVILTPFWSNGNAKNAGAVTFVNDKVGTISAANSFVGSSAGDEVGSGGITVLSNGNYIINSPYWTNGTAAYAGAATWASGKTGIHGVITSANSLVGSSANDRVGQGTGFGSVDGAALSDGNYLVVSPGWNNGKGAVTWGNGAKGIHGVVSATNSLVGSHNGDHVGSRGVVELTNGNYVVISSNWSNGTATNAGAVTWARGTTGIVGEVSAANSLVGGEANDSIGFGDILAGSSLAPGGDFAGVTALGNGNYVVVSHVWNNGEGAVTWGNGTTGVHGVVSSTNSLVSGSSDNGYFGGYIELLGNSNFLVVNSRWNNSGSTTDAGAVTFVDGSKGLTGVCECLK